MSMENLWEIGVGESKDDVISGLGRYQAAEFTYAKITPKPSARDEKCQWSTCRKSGSGNRTVTSFPVQDATTPPSGRIHMLAIPAIADEC
jgi:hypothetical protein